MDHHLKRILRRKIHPAGHVEAVRDKHIVHFADPLAIQPDFADRIDTLQHQLQPLTHPDRSRLERGRASKIDKLPIPQHSGIHPEIRVRDHPGPVQVAEHIARNPRRNRLPLPALRVNKRKHPLPVQPLNHRRVLRFHIPPLRLFCAKYRFFLVYSGNRKNQAGKPLF